MLTGYGSADKLQLSKDFDYEYFNYDAEGDLEALFEDALIGDENVLDTGRDGVLVVARDSTQGSSIDHWMILMSDALTPLDTDDFTGSRIPQLV
jgi:hypothetical protein